MTQVTAYIDGMMCGMCEAHIKDAIRKKIPETKSLSADHVRGVVKFRLPNNMPKGIIKHELRDSIEPLGYKVSDVHAVYS